MAKNQVSLNFCTAKVVCFCCHWVIIMFVQLKGPVKSLFPTWKLMGKALIRSNTQKYELLTSVFIVMTEKAN